MNKVNSDIRVLIFKNNIRMYKIADELGIHYATLNSKLRKELTKEEKEKIKKGGKINVRTTCTVTR